MPEASQNADEGDQRQPFQNAGRIEPPVWINRHQSDRSEEMPSVPPYRHCGVDEAARERPDNDLFFADAADLKPHGDQAQNNREQEKWPGSNDVAPEVLVGTAQHGVPTEMCFVTPPSAKQQDNWQKHDLRF